MSNHELVSIILPTYNGGRTVARAIASVISQTYQNWELIVVDDKSTDNTKEEINLFTDPRIKKMFLEQNSGGPAMPRTLGCKAAKGEIVAFIDQDDLFLPDYLRKKMLFLDSHQDITILSGMSWVFDLDKKKVIDCATFVPLNLLMRKGDIVSAGFFKENQNGVDEIGLLVRDTQNKGTKKHIAIFPEPLTVYNKHSGQNSRIDRVNDNVFIERIESLLEDLKDREIFPGDSISLYSRLGNFYSRSGNMKKGRWYLKKSFSIKPTLFSFVLYVFTFLGRKAYKVIENLLRYMQRIFF